MSYDKIIGSGEYKNKKKVFTYNITTGNISDLYNQISFGKADDQNEARNILANNTEIKYFFPHYESN